MTTGKPTLVERVLTVLLVDHRLAFAQALQLAIDATEGLACVGIAPTLYDAIASANGAKPDVVVLDLDLPDSDPSKAVEQLCELSGKVLALTARSDTGLLPQTLEAGASGFFEMDTPISTVIQAIRAVPEGAVIVGRVPLVRCVRQVLRATPHPPGSGLLSDRQLEVLQLLSNGFPPKAIAQELRISMGTCRSYIRAILTRLDTHSQLEAVSKGRRLGLIS